MIIQILTLLGVVNATCDPGQLTVNSQEDVKLYYASGATNEQITLDMNTIFSMSETTRCPDTYCSISDAGQCGSGTFSGSSDITLTGSSSTTWVVSASKSNVAGYSYQICLRCSNGGQTADLDNWKFSQCGALSGTNQAQILNQYEQSAANDQRTLDMNTIFANPNPTDCPISTCSISDAEQCGSGTFSGSSVIGLTGSASAPWVLSVSKSYAPGYNYRICLRCSNGGQTADLDKLQITQCGLSTGTIQTSILNQYEQGAANQDITLDLTAIFQNSASISCPISTCSISDAGQCGSGTFSGSTHIGLTGSSSTPWVLSVSKSYAPGYSFQICLRCSNGVQTVADLDNWNITQETMKFVTVTQASVTLDYTSGAPDEQKTLDVNTIFSNPDSTNHPISTCSISDGGQCGSGTFSGSSYISLTGSSSTPWVLSVSKSTPCGYSYLLCLRCSNGIQTADHDNWNFTQKAKAFKTDPLPDKILNYANGAPNEDVIDNVFLIFDVDSSSNCPITSCSLFNAGSCGSGTFSGSSDISLINSITQPWVVSASKSKEGGYLHSLCLRCSNNNQTGDIDNVKISQCGLSSGSAPSNILSIYTYNAPNEEITLEMNSIFANPNPTDCPISICSISNAGSCGSGTFSGSSEISLIGSSSTPWVLSISKSIAAGYSHQLCLRCSNSGQSVDLDNWNITQEKMQFVTVTQDDVDLSYTFGAADEQKTLDVNAIFTNPDSTNYPISTCSLSNAGSCGSGTFSGSSEISLTGSSSAPWVLSISQSIAAGYSHQLCLRCSNGIQTADHDNWNISQQKMKFVIVTQDSVTFDYTSSAPDEQKTLDVNTIFTNPDPSGFPITTCSISDGGQCGSGTFSGSSYISLTGSSSTPWVLSVSKSTPCGYSYLLCLRCSNGIQTADHDNWNFTQKAKAFKTDPLPDKILNYASGAPNEDVIDNANLIFDVDSSNCPITECTLFNAGSCGTGTFSGSSDISLINSITQPWVVSASKSKEGGYLHSLCLRCSNNNQTGDIDNVKISQCGISNDNTQQDLLLSFLQNAPKVETNANTIFTNPNPTDCPMTSCSISNAGDCGSGTFSGSSHISLTGSASTPWVISASRSYGSGYSYQVCLSCTIGGQTEDHDNWKITQEIMQLQAVTQDDIILNYSYKAPNEELTLDVETIFTNPDPVKYPITSCEIYDAGKCGSGTFSGLSVITLKGSQPWVISASKSEACGYSHQLCLRCTNGIKNVTLDNWNFTQIEMKFVSVTQEDLILNYAPGESDSQIELDVNTIFTNPDPTDYPITSCSISNAGQCGSGTFSGSSYISLTGSSSTPWILSASQSTTGPNSYSFCLRCTNDCPYQDLDNWNLHLCSQELPSVSLPGGSYILQTSKIFDTTTVVQYMASSISPSCDPSGPISLTSDTLGSPAASDGILSVTLDGYLKVDYDKIPIVGEREYVWYLYGLNRGKDTRYSQIKFQAKGCDSAIEGWLRGLVAGQSVREFLNKPTNVTETFEALDILNGQNFNDDPLCQLVQNQAQILRFEFNGYPYTSSSLYVENNSIILNRDRPFNVNIDAIYYFEALNKEFQRQFKVIICGFETLYVESGFTKVDIKLSLDDAMEKLPASQTKITQVMKSSSQECVIESYWLAKNTAGDPLDMFTGVDFLSLEDDYLMFNRGTAISGSFSAFLMAKTLGGLSAYYEFQLRITKAINQAPQFQGVVTDIVLEVNQLDQMEDRSKEITIVSPKIEDQEGNVIIYYISGAENLDGVTMTKSSNRFTVTIDESKINATSSNQITITLTDDGPDPKFENVVTFMINIQYNNLPEQTVEEIKEDQEFEQSLEDSAVFSVAEVSGESVTERKQRIKNLKVQTQKIGITFPGVSEDQMANANSTQDQEKVIEEPAMKISKVSPLGQVFISFNQRMFYPKNISEISNIFDYSKVLKFSIIQAKDGRIQKASFSSTKRLRNLEMTMQEKLDYFSSIPYDASHELEEDRFKKRGQSSKQSNSVQQKQNEAIFFQWQVNSHNATDLVIQLSFADAGEISSTKLGRDKIIIDILDTSLFRSQLTLKSVDPLKYNKLQKDLPPQIQDETIVESIQQSTDIFKRITTYLSSANFFVGIFIGGSMQHLFSLIRAMQMIILPFLSDVQYPAHTYIFFQGAILFASMDIFSGEHYFSKWFEFQPTEPINQRFEEFGMTDKNFFMQSGSFLIMQVGILVWHLIRWAIYKTSVKFARFKYARMLGMYLEKQDLLALKKATFRLFLESYFDVSNAVFLGIYGLAESDNLSKFFSTFDDVLCSLITILVFILTLAFPIWFLYKVNKDPNFKHQYDLFFKGMRDEEPYYQFFFMLRRLLISLLLTFFHPYPAIQITAFLGLSVLQMTYLVDAEPFLKTMDLRVEIFNEACILLSLIEIFTLLNPAMEPEVRNFTGWMLIYTVGVNVTGNLMIVSYSMACDVATSISESIELRLQDSRQIGTDEEARDLKFCREWHKMKIWLDENGVDSSQFEEQIKFDELVIQHHYRERAKQLEIIHAFQKVSQRVRQCVKKIERPNSRSQVRPRLSFRTQRVRANAAKGTGLKTIAEISKEESDSFAVQQMLDDEGMLAGPIAQLDINLFEKIDSQGLKPLNFDFLNSLDTDAIQNKVFQRLMMSKEERWTNEFSKTSKRITLETDQRNISFVLQCLISTRSVIKEIMTSDYEDVKMQRLQKLYMMMLQRQVSNLEFNSIPIYFFTSLFPKGISASAFFKSIFPATQTPFSGLYEIDGVNTPQHILMLPDSSSLSESMHMYFKKVIVKKQPQALVLGIQQTTDFEFPLKYLNYHLFAVVYNQSAIVRRKQRWYKICGENIDKVRQREVTKRKSGVKMLFYAEMGTAQHEKKK